MDNLQQSLHVLLNSLTTVNLEAFYQNALTQLSNGNIAQMSASAATSFALIAAAEIGDKSQLVCMTLASRHRAFPVILGAISAFAMLNTLAVIFGVAIASWLPDYIVAGTVALLFAAFGIHALRMQEDEDDEEVKEKKRPQHFLHHVFTNHRRRIW